MLRRSLPSRRLARALLALAAALLGAAACSEGNSGVVGRGGPERVCSEGDVQACQGAGDCDGEQACLDHGLGFGPCQCLPEMSGQGGNDGEGGKSHAGASTADAGAGGEGGASCTASCDLLMPAVCSQGTRSVCLELQVGCPELVTLDCPSGFCADEQLCGVCPQQCAAVDEPGCAKGALRSCATDERGCRVWGDPDSACSSGFCAEDGEGCGSCAHECPTTGVSECQAGQFRRCAEDAFGCRRWWFWAACELGSCADTEVCGSGFSQRQRGSPLDDVPRALAIDALGRVVMAGGYHEFDVEQGGLHEEFDAHLHAVAPDGALKIFESWGDALEADEALSLAVASDDSYVLVGYTEGTVGSAASRGGRDAFLSRWSKEQPTQAPKLLYSRQWGSADDDAAVAVALNRDDTAYVFGTSASDLFLTRWDSAGNGLGTWAWGTTGLDFAASVLVDSSDNVLVAGTTEGTLAGETSAGQGDAFVSRLNPDGSAAWTTQLGTTGDERVAQMVFDRQGNLLVIGTTDGTFAGASNVGQTDVFLSKLDPSGAVIFTRQWGTADADVAAGVVESPDGRIFAAITVEGAEQGCEPGQALLLEWNATATQATTRLFDTCEEERATAITADPNGVVYMAGTTRGVLAGDEARGGTDIFTVVSQITN